MDRRRALNLTVRVGTKFVEYAKADLVRLGEPYASQTKIPDLHLIQDPNDASGKKFTAEIEGTNPIFAAALANACGHVSQDVVRGARQNLDTATTTAEFILA